MPPFLAFLLHPTVEHKMLAFPVAAAAAVAPGADIVNEKCLEFGQYACGVVVL